MADPLAEFVIVFTSRASHNRRGKTIRANLRYIAQSFIIQSDSNTHVHSLKGRFSMGCFSGAFSHVVNTRIFARIADADSQFLVYQMDYKADNDLAMILPLPTPPGATHHAVRFIDLSAYPQFFSDLEKGLPKPRGMEQPGDVPPRKIPVQRVGSFDASFVPSHADFAGLDAQFRIDDAVWHELPEYHDYGFAVFKLRADARTVHPIAFEFQTRNPKLLFFPTVHVLDGSVPANAYFDHDLYCQHHMNWMRSYDNAQAFMNVPLTQGIVAADKRVEWLSVRGMHPNSDIVMKSA